MQKNQKLRQQFDGGIRNIEIAVMSASVLDSQRPRFICSSFNVHQGCSQMYLITDLVAFIDRNRVGGAQ